MTGLSARPAQSGVATLDADALIRAALRILAAYLLLTALPLARWCAAAHVWWPLMTHLIALGASTSVAFAGFGMPRTMRDWLPLALGPFLYIELRWIIEGAARTHSDAVVGRWEWSLFGSDLSRTLAARWPSLALSELLHASYISYYALIYLPPALLWLRHRRREYAATVLALVAVYAICFIIYVIFPVDGPRYMHGASAAPDGPVRAIVLRLLESGSSRGTAFPSSHVAASVVAASCALRFQRAVGAIVASLTLGLAVGAVYGGFHYGVDIVAGVATGAGAIAFARLLERRMRI